ncbi:PorP/SprF family type IX secretion system membrane protein [Lutibacter maritimus]|uniref:Type IX secretion system membrane protein, PorP/SprF family n=1 Tax=Lutibacter maritimus TaxID=593133 RepID=A0A1I6PJQ1_9FLAO|nr:type IX secretion system membrane protein PorP/SprF [Lutibacter maritimus]SFS40417.1 type IX secretion system membrane protein, PorP/SprF family [Lutibacter maritimus]
MKNIFKNSVLVLILAIGFESFAQQDPLYTQYYNNFSLINPAYAGSHGLFTATANIRSQWAGEAGSPETQTLSLHGPVGKNVGLGLSILNDKVFVLSETHVYADFSYSIYPSEYSTLAFGLKVGGSFLDVNLLELGIENDNLFSENLNEFNPNIGAGAFYYTNRFYASVSTVNILQTKHYNKSNAVVSSASDEMIFYLSSGYVFDLSDDFKIRPSVMLRVVNGSPLSTDISTSVLWLDKLEFGISHRINESISGLFQLRLTNNLKVGYTYDAITSNLSNYNNGSHEFSIILNIGKNKNTRKPPFYWMKNKNSEEILKMENEN